MPNDHNLAAWRVGRTAEYRNKILPKAPMNPPKIATATPIHIPRGFAGSAWP
jgi:hypothetical protein